MSNRLSLGQRRSVPSSCWRGSWMHVFHVSVGLYRYCQHATSLYNSEYSNINYFQGGVLSIPDKGFSY